MNIVIYTTIHKGSVNTFNINELISKCPEHNYFFVVVKKEFPALSWKKKLKRFLVELRDGKNFWLRDLEVLENKILKKCEKVDYDKFPVYYVETVNGEKAQDVIENIGPDLIIQAGAGILKKNIFGIAKKATLNIHHGYAPEIRGIQSTFWCLYYGLTDLIGVTCHIIDDDLDTGSVIFKYRFPYKEGDTFVSIQQKLCEKGGELLVSAIKLFESNEELKKEEKELMSYYFGVVNDSDYNELKRNNYSAILDVATLKKKKLIETTILI